jgi:hypothetical protein
VWFKVNQPNHCPISASAHNVIKLTVGQLDLTPRVKQLKSLN